MCFANEKVKLDVVRRGKGPIWLWKASPIDPKTGLVRTHYDSDKDEVWWVKGKVVKPNKIKKPHRDQQECNEGLYFYTNERAAKQRVYSTRMALIKCSVKPEHIIAVNYDGSQMLAIEAKVLDAPNPNPIEMKTKWLKERIKVADARIRAEEQNMERWLARKDDDLEARQQIKDELETLTPSKKRRKR